MKHKIIFILGLFALMAYHSDKKITQAANDEKILHQEKIISVTVDSCDMRNLHKCNFYSTMTKKIKSMALSGEIKVYENYTDIIPLSTEKIRSKLKPRNIGFKYQDKITGEQKVILTMDSLSVLEIRFIEDWTFNANNGNISKKTLGYGLYYMEMDTLGNNNGKKSFFWVKNMIK